MRWCSWDDDEYDDREFEFKKQAVWQGEMLYDCWWHKPRGAEEHPCIDFDFGPLASSEEGQEEARQ